MSLKSYFDKVFGRDRPVNRGRRYFIEKCAIIGVSVIIPVYFSGCLKEGEEGSSVVEDLGEPIDEVNGIVGKEYFGIPDVYKQLTEEGSVYALFEKEFGKEETNESEKEETDAKAEEPVIGNYRDVVIATYLGKDGRDVIKLTVDDQDLGEITEEESELIKSNFIPEEDVMPLIKKTKDGRYDCSRLKELTEKDYIYDYSIFPEGKPTERNDEIIGNSENIFGLPDVPEIFFGRIGGKDIIVFNQAFADIKKMGRYGRPTIEEGLKIEDLKWDQELILENPNLGKFYSELGTDTGVYCQIRDGWNEDVIFGTPDRSTCVCKEKLA